MNEDDVHSILLPALTATSGEDTHTTVRGRGTYCGEGVSLFLSGLAGSQEEGASLTWSGGYTTGKGERERIITTGHTCQSLVDRRESERPKGAQLLALKGAKA